MTMRIKIQKDLCCGAQLCVQFAPEIYRLDALGYNDSDGDLVSASQEEQATRGARSCPEGAISLEANDGE